MSFVATHNDFDRRNNTNEGNIASGGFPSPERSPIKARRVYATTPSTPVKDDRRQQTPKSRPTSGELSALMVRCARPSRQLASLTVFWLISDTKRFHDRFIPNRRAMNLEISHFNLMKEDVVPFRPNKRRRPNPVSLNTHTARNSKSCLDHRCRTSL